MNFGTEGDTELKAWRDIWSAGQSVSGIGEVMPVQALVDRMAGEYESVRSRLARAP
jgi:nitronate monooxygenase